MAHKSRLFKLEALMGGGGEPAIRSLASRSPRSFANGAVGLGIVAAMSGGEVALPMAARSEPIPIVSGARARARPVLVDEDEEKSESYTCVISHVGGNMARKRVYFDDGSECDGTFGNCDSITGFVFESLPPAPVTLSPPPAMDFMSCCYLCRKKLRGLDIFMYRGDKAFCSVECRCQQMLNDELLETCGSQARKSYDCSVSPCSIPLPFTAGLAAA